MKPETNHHYFSGGLAEIVTQPSQSTMLLLEKWFTGAGSLGKAMELVGLPYTGSFRSVLALSEGELVVDLKAEEAALYASTFLGYLPQKKLDKTPQLSIVWSKFFNPLTWWPTLSITMQQARWIADPQKMVGQVERWVKQIELAGGEQSSDELIKIMGQKVWPQVIAVDLVSEFYSQYLAHESKKEYPEMLSYISAKVAERDWLFQSLEKQYAVQAGELSLNEYLKEFGIRADKDYEITCPRWHEIPEIIAARIKNLPPKTNRSTPSELPDLKFKPLVEAVIECQIMRSEAKRKALAVFDELRSALSNEWKNGAVGSIKERSVTKVQLEGKGMGISAGTAQGSLFRVSTIHDVLPPNSVVIFPNASPEFSFLYSHCRGMIFLKGGQTSHGAIVAREYQIPALVDPQADGLPDECTVEIDGSTGKWHVIGQGETSTSKIEKVEIHSLATVSAKDRNKVGGKAAHLGELLKLDMPAPEGFVVTFPDDLKKNCEFSSEVEESILKAFDQLKSSEVAVRSSAIGEDSSSVSFAGQFETILEVKKSGLLAAIKKCLASAEQTGVKDYADQHGVSDAGLKLAVCIQAMVPSEVAGVMFTKNVITNDSSEILIEAVKGLGESLAQGNVIPQQYLVNKKSGEVHKTPDEEPLLSEENLKKLTSLALKIEKHFEVPQDIEWAVVDGEIWILQARAVTT